MSSREQHARISLKLGRSDLDRVDKLCASLPYSTRHAVLVTAVRAGIDILTRNPAAVARYAQRKNEGDRPQHQQPGARAEQRRPPQRDEIERDEDLERGDADQDDIEPDEEEDEHDDENDETEDEEAIV